MATLYEIPLTATPQQLMVPLSGVTYQLTIVYRNCAGGGWFMDIADINLVPLICGIPLVTGANLLEQYAYMGIIGEMYVSTDGDNAAVPTFDNLGTDSHLYYYA